MKEYYEFLDNLFRRPVIGRFLALFIIWASGVVAGLITEKFNIYMHPVALFLTIYGIYPWMLCLYHINVHPELSSYIFFGIPLLIMSCTTLILFIKPTLKKCIIASSCIMFLQPIVSRFGLHYIFF